MARTTYDPAVKAAAMAALLTGQSVASVAAAYKLPLGTVKAWRRRTVTPELADAGEAIRQADAADAPPGAPPASTKSAEVGGLLLEYLSASIKALTVQVTLFGDVEWLKQQDAQSLGVLHGIQTDKAVRLLEALGGTAPEPDALA